MEWTADCQVEAPGGSAKGHCDGCQRNYLGKWTTAMSDAATQKEQNMKRVLYM